MYALKELTSGNVKRISDEVWKKYFDMRIQINERSGSKTPFLNWEQLKKGVIDSLKNDKNRHCISLIQKGKDFHGYFIVSSMPSGSRRKHLEVFYNSVHTDALEEIVSLISGQIKKYFNKEKDGIILFQTFNDTFREIALKLNGKLGEYTIRMNLPDLAGSDVAGYQDRIACSG